jgi:hypothetical protein
MSKIIFMMQKGCKPRAKCVASLAQSQSGSWRCMGSAGPTNQHGAAMPDVKRLTLPTLMWRLSIVGAPKVHPLAKSVAIIGQTKFLWFVCACMHAAILFIFGKQYRPFLDVSGCMHACMHACQNPGPSLKTLTGHRADARSCRPWYWCFFGHPMWILSQRLVGGVWWGGIVRPSSN